MTIKELCTQMLGEGLTVVEISHLLGVGSLQVKLYMDGRTARPGVKVALAALKHIKHSSGDPVVLSEYAGPQAIVDGVATYAGSNINEARDHAVGYYVLKS